jgi:hypothetical protein
MVQKRCRRIESIADEFDGGADGVAHRFLANGGVLIHPAAWLNKHADH